MIIQYPCLCYSDCGNITTPSNGNFTYTGTVYGDTVNYTCNIGYILQGNSTRECNASGAWTNTDPTCEPVGNAYGLFSYFLAYLNL